MASPANTSARSVWQKLKARGAPVWDRFGPFAGQPQIAGAVVCTAAERRVVIEGRRGDAGRPQRPWLDDRCAGEMAGRLLSILGRAPEPGRCGAQVGAAAGASGCYWCEVAAGVTGPSLNLYGGAESLHASFTFRVQTEVSTSPPGVRPDATAHHPESNESWGRPAGALPRSNMMNTKRTSVMKRLMKRAIAIWKDADKASRRLFEIQTGITR